MAIGSIKIGLYRIFARRALPELMRLNEDEQRTVLLAVEWTSGWRVKLLMYAAFIGWFVISMVFVKHIAPAWSDFVPGFQVLAALASYVVYFSLSWTAVAWVLFRLEIPVFRRAVTEVLRARGEPRCPECGYDLQGLEKLRCPECGHEEGVGHVTTPDKKGGD